MLFYGKHGGIGRCKDIHLFITKELFKLITDLLLTSIKTVCQSSDKGFAEFCKQCCTTLTMVLQNFVIR